MSSEKKNPATTFEHRRTQLTVSYFIAFVTLGSATASLGPALPYLAENTGSLLSQISYIFIAYRVGYMLGSFFGGQLYDRKPGGTVMGLMLLVITLGLALVPLSVILYVLLAVLFVVGFAGGAVDVGGNILLVWIHHRKLPPLMNALHLFYGVGALIKKINIEDNGEATVISYTSNNDFFKGKTENFPVTRFLLELTQHIPPRGSQYIRRYGLYASRTKGKWLQMPHVVRHAPSGCKKEHLEPSESEQPYFEESACSVSDKESRCTWAMLIVRVYEVDPLICSRCGSPMRILAVITEPEEVNKILRHLVKIGRSPFNPAALN